MERPAAARLAPITVLEVPVNCPTAFFIETLNHKLGTNGAETESSTPALPSSVASVRSR